jgi:acyl carrier protein
VTHDRETVRQALAGLLEEEMGQNYPDLEDTKRLRDDLGLDSVDVVSIVSQVERRYRIRLSHEELMTLTTVGDVLTLLVAKLNAPPAQEQPPTAAA